MAKRNPSQRAAVPAAPQAPEASASAPARPETTSDAKSDAERGAKGDAEPGAKGDAKPAPKPEVRQSRLGYFIQTYSSFLSSFVIGAAGLVATTMYQYNQSKIAAEQAKSQIRIAESQAENSWRIERAKILSQNLQVLSAQGSGNVEQRYGVLLSLTRGNILDSELAVSYALELGRENADYMHSVLSSTRDKDYRRLASAFTLTCEQRFGVTRAVDACKGDKLQERSAALAEVIAEETEGAQLPEKPGPLALLREDRDVLLNLTRYLWLFAPFLADQVDRRQWDVLERFRGFSSGARLLQALAVLGGGNGGSFVSSAEAAQIDRFRDELQRFLTGFLVGPNCDGDCRGRVASVLLSAYARSGGDFDTAMQTLLSRPRAEIGGALGRLNQRLRLCQVASADAVALRDQVIVPLALSALTPGKADATKADDLIGLLALLPEPEAPEGAPTPGAPVAPASPMARYRALQDLLAKTEGGRYQRLLLERRQKRQQAQRTPSLSERKSSFCNAASGGADAATDEE